MGLFNRNKQIISEEYADALNKIIKIHNDVSIMRQEIDALKTNMNSVRGLINRKLGKYEEEQEEIENPIDAVEVQRRLMGFGKPD